MVHPVAAADALKDVRLLILPLRGQEHSDGPANGLGGGVAKDAFCALVPTSDNAVKVLADNGVVGGIHNRGQPTLPIRGAFVFFARGKVPPWFDN